MNAPIFQSTIVTTQRLTFRKSNSITQFFRRGFLFMDSPAILLLSFLYLALGHSNLILAQNVDLVHWINDAGQDAATVLNGAGVFTTDFKAHNDLTVTRLTPDSVALDMDSFGGASPGNNTAYLRNFVGITTNGT